MKTQTETKAQEAVKFFEAHGRKLLRTSLQRQAAVARAKAKRDKFKGTASATTLLPSVIPCKKSGIKYNGNPLSCMA